MKMFRPFARKNVTPQLRGTVWEKPFESARNRRLAADSPATYVPANPLADLHEGLAEARLDLVREAAGLVS